MKTENMLMMATGNYSPTLTHYFFVLLHKKGLLKRVFTQNVDTLERLAGLPGDMLVEAHGSFATAHCLSCREKFEAETLRPRIAKGEILRCENASCKDKPKALIKSDIVCASKVRSALSQTDARDSLWRSAA